MGSGGLIVMDEDTCMVDVARFFLDFIQDETCGKCPPCRVGTKRMLEILTRICNGQGEEGDIEKLERPGQHHQGHRALRPRPDGAQPGALDHPPLPPRVRGPHPATSTARPGVCSTHVHGPVQQRLPGQRQRARLRQSHRREALRRGPARCTANATRWPVSAAGSASIPARASASAARSTRRWPSAASSAS